MCVVCRGKDEERKAERVCVCVRKREREEPIESVESPLVSKESVSGVERNTCQIFWLLLWDRKKEKRGQKNWRPHNTNNTKQQQQQRNKNVLQSDNVENDDDDIIGTIVIIIIVVVVVVVIM